MGLSDWDDRLTQALVRRPFRDEEGRKGWLTRLTRSRPHRVRELALALPGWPRFSRPLRIAFLSDLHVGAHAGDVARIEAIVAEAAARAPDLVLYGGDFVNMILFGGGRVPPRTIARILVGLPAPLGQIAVLGNHDREYGPEEVTKALRDHGIAVLADERQSVAFEGATIDILGIHDARIDRPAARALLAGLRPERPSLVLAHDPFWFGAMPAGPHFMLAGHTHAGQIRLPLVGALRNASHAPMRWTYGLIEEGGRRMYVTGGLGSSGLPLRIGAPPEYVVIEVNGA